MASQKVQFLRCAASFVTAAYRYVRLIPQDRAAQAAYDDMHALNLALFALPSLRWLFRLPQVRNLQKKGEYLGRTI
jgi:hypothetical protein